MAGHKVPVLDRWLAFPFAVFIPVIRNPGLGTATGAGENKQPGVLVNEVGQGLCF